MKQTRSFPHAAESVTAARHCVAADALNWILYPDDSTEAGRELRLKQEAFLVSASLQDLVARELRERGSLDELGRRNAHDVTVGTRLEPHGFLPEQRAVEEDLRAGVRERRD